jgi:hypothetical protein
MLGLGAAAGFTAAPKAATRQVTASAAPANPFSQSESAGIKVR